MKFLLTLFVALNFLHAYKGTENPKEQLDFYKSKSAGNPLLIYVHGGAWVSGDKSDYKELAQHLQKHFHVAVINYKLSPAVQHPSHVNDLKAALNFLLKDQAILSSKIFLMGHSAGAFNIAFLATEMDDPRIAGFVGLSGIYDLADLDKRWPSYNEWFLRKTFGKNINKQWEKNSPARMNLKSKAPWLLLHSLSDELVDVDQSQKFHEHLLAQKIPAKIVNLKNLPHFGVIPELGQDKSFGFQELKNFVELSKKK